MSTLFPEFGNTGEPIYALMLTGKDVNRARFAENSVVSFLAQSYVNRILVIVNDGVQSFDSLGVPRERLIVIQAPRSMLVGDLRNLGLNAIPEGAVWVQWDDDDWHHPHFIEMLHRKMTDKGYRAATIRAQVKVDLRKNAAWIHQLPPGYAGFAGTVMARQNPAHRYPSRQFGEDSVFWAALLSAGNAGAVDLPPECYLRFIHDTNASSHLTGNTMLHNKWNVPVHISRYLLEVLPRYDQYSRSIAPTVAFEGAVISA